MSEFDIPTDVVVGKKYLKYYGDHKTPWLEDNENLQKSLSQNKWTRWDGVEGTAESHMDWLNDQARSLMSDERSSEYRAYGEKRGVKYFIHDEMTAKGGGYGFFKLEGTLQIEARDMVASMFDFHQTAESDETVVLMRNIKTYKEKGDGPFVAAAYWCNDPGFPFYYRDGLDLSGYRKDDDGTYWQLSVSAKGKDFVSMPGAIAGEDLYWAYRLVPNDDGTTKTTLICQTKLNGWIPKFLSNYFLCAVLIDYMVRSYQKTGKAWSYIFFYEIRKLKGLFHFARPRPRRPFAEKRKVENTRNC